MRVLCLDIGEKRIGVAVSDPLDLTAQGVETIRHKSLETDLQRVKELCAQYATDRIVCGLPRNMDGSEGFQAQRIRTFVGHLTDSGFTVRLQDERLTTKQARDVLLAADVRRSKRKDYIDKLAATYILQAFLDAGGWREEPEIIRKTLIGGTYTMSDQIRDNIEQQEYATDNLVTLVDENGQEVAFEHLMSLEHKGKTYICLAPAEPMEDVEEDELVVMRIETDAEGNDYYTTIDNEEELTEVFEKYCELAEADEE